MEKPKSKRPDLKKKIRTRQSPRYLEVDHCANNMSLTDEIENIQLSRETNHLTCPNSLLPHLVWEIVLKKLPKTDIENCTNASLYFRSILKKDHEMHVLLPKVFEILAKRYNDPNNMDFSYREKKSMRLSWSRPTRSVWPNKMTGIWKCRLVCKHWNQIIEDLHENEDAGHFDLKYEINPSHNSYIQRWAVEEFPFGGDSYSRHVDSTHFESGITKNPFLGRSVYFKPDGLLQNEDFLSVLNLLQRYGREIWYFTYREPRDERYGFDGLLFYLRLTAMVALMPNLKVLRLKYIQVEDGSLEHLQAMEHTLATNPFPKLENLKLFSTYKLPNQILNHILIQNNHIIQMEVRQISKYGEIEVFKNLFPNITVLSLEFRSVEDFEKLENYPFLMKLQKVQLRWHKSAPFIRWSRIFHVLETKISERYCTEILLDLPIPREETNRKIVSAEQHVYQLNFPKLKYVTIFEKLPDYNLFQSEVKEAAMLNQAEVDLAVHPNFVTLKKFTDNPVSIYREPLLTLKICSGFKFDGSASLIDHQKLKTCRFDYQAKTTALKSFSQNAFQLFNKLPYASDWEIKIEPVND